MLNIKKHIPNFLTLCNLWSGIASIIFSFNGQLEYAAYAILIASLFDFSDGLMARVLNARSDIGMQLDSLSDLISFGVAPGFILFHHMKGVAVNTEGFITLLPYLAFIIPAFSALRLAKFNIDERQTDSFIGLPTPANAAFFASIPLILAGNQEFAHTLLNNIWVLGVLAVIMSLLLVAELPLLSLKFKKFSWKENQNRWLLIGVGIALIAIFKFLSIPLILVFYVLLSLLSNQKAQKA